MVLRVLSLMNVQTLDLLRGGISLNPHNTIFLEKLGTTVCVPLFYQACNLSKFESTAKEVFFLICYLISHVKNERHI